MYQGNDILNRIKATIHESEPSAKIYLYGSRARESASNESDWDILILIKRDKVTDQIEHKITDPLYDLEFETGEVISPMVYSEKEWDTKYSITSFYHNVMNEGKLL